MPSDIEYLSNYLPQSLYIHPGPNGAYATLVSEHETILGEIEVTNRSRLAVSAFFVSDRDDFGTFKITKLQYNKRFGWKEDGHVRLSKFHADHMRAFVAILAGLKLQDSAKARVSLENVSMDAMALAAMLASTRGGEFIRQIASSPELHEDIYAVVTKRRALDRFGTMLDESPTEPDWQAFFEANTWIFGHGLNYIFLDKVANKLEAPTTGHTFDAPGKVIDGLLRTRAEVSQYVLVEIKRSDTELLRNDQYRRGCWAISHELAGAVTQVQKSVHSFTRDRFRSRLKDEQGNDLPGEVYSVEPRSYLVVGNLRQVYGNDDKVTCFELFRRNVRAPEILTFDELYARARCIVENVSPPGLDQGW